VWGGARGSGDRGLACGARTARGSGWRRVGIEGVAGDDARVSEGWCRARLVWSVWGLAGGHAREEEH
jgi:hypothetical protein